eukprot:5943816-Amphidinium_carterae.1
MGVCYPVEAARTTWQTFLHAFTVPLIDSPTHLHGDDTLAKIDFHFISLATASVGLDCGSFGRALLRRGASCARMRFHLGSLTIVQFGWRGGEHDESDQVVPRSKGAA